MLSNYATEVILIYRITNNENVQRRNYGGRAILLIVSRARLARRIAREKRTPYAMGAVTRLN